MGDRSNVRFGSKADMAAPKLDVRFTPQSGHVQRKPSVLLWAISGHGGRLLLDDLVGLRKYQRGNFNTLCFCRFCIHDQFESCRLFNRQFAWFCAFQNFVDKSGSTVKPFLDIR
jgi:hypothetical protein